MRRWCSHELLHAYQAADPNPKAADAEAPTTPPAVLPSNSAPLLCDALLCSASPITPQLLPQPLGSTQMLLQQSGSEPMSLQQSGSGLSSGPMPSGGSHLALQPSGSTQITLQPSSSMRLVLQGVGSPQALHGAAPAVPVPPLPVAPAAAGAPGTPRAALVGELSSLLAAMQRAGMRPEEAGQLQNLVAYLQHMQGSPRK